MNAQLGHLVEQRGRCRVCRRILKSKKWAELGIGPTCARKEGATRAFDSSMRGRLDAPLAVPMQTDVRIWRESDGRLHANVPHSVIWHSPDGFECGYEGSGPADLALNILNAFVPPGRPIDYEREEVERDDEPEKCWKGVASRFACRHHQEFKRQFIGRMDKQGGRLEAKQISDWIAARQQVAA